MNSLQTIDFRARIEGRIDGPNVDKSWPLLSFAFSVNFPHDSATGLASGKAVRNPVVVTVPWADHSPELLLAAFRNEVFTKVEITFRKATADGSVKTYHTITLNDAEVSHFSESGVTGRTLEIHFTYRKMTQSTPTSEVADDWFSPA